jgi:hypothetical protein
VEIQAELRAPSAERCGIGRQNAVEIIIAFEDGPEAIFNNDSEPQVRPRAFEDFRSGRGEHAVSQRPQAQDSYPAVARQTVQNAFHGGLFFDLGFINQHDWNIIANRVDAIALDTSQAALVGLKIQGGLA